MGPDREGVYQRRWLSRQALHGTCRPAIQPVPSSDPRRKGPLPQCRGRNAQVHRRSTLRKASERMIELVNMIVLAKEDNVGIALQRIAAGEIALASEGRKITSHEEVPLGHKIALAA